MLTCFIFFIFSQAMSLRASGTASQMSVEPLLLSAQPIFFYSYPRCLLCYGSTSKEANRKEKQIRNKKKSETKNQNETKAETKAQS